MEFNEVIKKRSSTRRFSDRKVEEDKLIQILEAGRLAPTAKNIEPIVIYVVTSDEGLSKVDMVSPCRYNAKACLIVCGDKTKAFSKGEHSLYEVDATIVATHMILAAENANIDSTWIAMFDGEKIKELFNLDEGVEPVAIINLGYKTDDCPVNVNHTIRKALSEIVKYV